MNMRIIFTNKLSKMVAHYENLCDMIFELNTSFDINTSWDSGEESIQYHGQDLLAEKTLSVTLNDISSRNEVRASRYLTLKNNKITVEEEQQDIDKLGKLCSERKACRQKWLTTLCLSGIQMCITWYLCSSHWDRVIPKWFRYHNTASGCMHVVNTYYLKPTLISTYR